jgi:hypothetical protein
MSFLSMYEVYALCYVRCNVHTRAAKVYSGVLPHVLYDSRSCSLCVFAIEAKLQLCTIAC